MHFNYRENASNFHKKVGECLAASPIFNGFTIQQEYPVVSVNTSYEESSHHFDWVILDLHIVIECMGRQHYEVTDFSGKSDDGGIAAFKAQRKRDQAKKTAAIEAGWTYIEINYKDEKHITDEFIWRLYQANKNTSNVSNAISKSRALRDDYLASQQHKKVLERARQWRKEQYANSKARLARRRTNDKD